MWDKQEELTYEGWDILDQRECDLYHEWLERELYWQWVLEDTDNV